MIQSWSFWLWQLCCPLWFLLTNPLPIVESKNLLSRFELALDLCCFSLSAVVKRLKVFLRCQSLFQLGLWFSFTRCTTRLPLLIVYCYLPSATAVIFSSFIVLSINLSISLHLSFSVRLFLHTFSFFLHRLFPASDQPNLYPSDKSDDVFRLFFTSCPPTSSLSSVLGVHTVFPTYMSCTMCNTYTVTHTHALSNTHAHTHTDHSAVHITVALVFLFGPEKCSDKMIYRSTFSHTHTHSKHWLNMLYELHYFLKRTILTSGY